ncbi:hypothetical protein DMN91_012547 [Ooceraea biroi]|uniref:Mos1 transposase HTH domain-containing protein n=1 Tax=Ooceraea biroi TaxID=2015173 RepID=A0A3L8D6A0_OOCBI|nr:hypothetical protein DMN91_012547 [Ooceraea biroi]
MEDAADSEEIVCAREDNALPVERVAEWNRTDKRWGGVRLLLFGARLLETRKLPTLCALTAHTEATEVSLRLPAPSGDVTYSQQRHGYLHKAPRTMEKSKIRVVYEHEFRRGTTVSETARNINAVFGEGSTTKATVGDWFKNFRDGAFSLANEPRGRPKTKVDNDHLRAVVESDPSQSTRGLASIFNVSIPTILFI